MRILSAIAGDICGSTYEGLKNNIKTEDITSIDIYRENSHFTDDTVLTVATCDCLLNSQNQDPISFAKYYHKWAEKYPFCGYGSGFRDWMNDPTLNNSFGNGAAMRISPVAWFDHNQTRVLKIAENSAKVSHNHPDGIKGAMMICELMYWLINSPPPFAKQLIRDKFKWNLNFSLKEIRSDYFMTSRAMETVPQAIVAFIEAAGIEKTIQTAISIGGDSDTIACIAAGLSGTLNPMPKKLIEFCKQRLTHEMWDVLEQFNSKFCSWKDNG